MFGKWLISWGISLFLLLDTTTVFAATVTITSPAAGASVTSPVAISGQVSSGTAVKAMAIYLDYNLLVKRSQVASISASASLSPGSHHLTIKAWLAGSSTIIKQSETFMIVSGSTSSPILPSPSPTPVTAVSPTPTPISAASGVDYYVSPGGSDNNNGSAGSPWLTLQHAASTVRAGAVVHVLAGTYNIGSSTIQMNNGGSFSGSGCSSRVTFEGDYNKSSRTWNSRVVAMGAQVISLNAACIDVIGLDLSISNAVDTSPVIKANYSGARVMSNSTHGSHGTCILGGGAAQYLTIDGNWVHDCGPSDHSSNLDHGIYITANHALITNNVVFNSSAYCITVYNSTSGEPWYDTVSSNTVWGCAKGISVSGPEDYNVITNNIIRDLWGSYSYGIVKGSGTHDIVANNLIWNITGARYDGVSSYSGDLNADPKMVNFQSNGSGDYHLQSTSPAVDSGTSSGAPKNDFEFFARPYGIAPDRGAFEWHP